MRLENCCQTAFLFELLLNIRNFIGFCVFTLRSIVVFYLVIMLLIEQLIKRQILLKDLVRQIFESAEGGPLERWAVVDDAGDGLVGEFVAPAEVELFEVGALVGDGEDGLVG